MFKRQEDLPYPQPWEWIRDNILTNNNAGFYVDVGANDGLIVSNTAYFDLNLGWNGICIEPHPRAFLKLQENRPNAINLNLCVSLDNTEVDFIAIDGYAEMLSGIEKNYHPDHISRIDSDIQRWGGTKSKIKVISKPLSSILQEYNIKSIDYLSIDTEGSELDILKSIDFLSVDINAISTENSNKSDIKPFLESKGFIFAGQVCADEIYYKK